MPLPTIAAQLSEANDAIGAARDALNAARTAKARREIGEELDWWIGKRAALNVAR
jgi:hypothetical protein